MRKCLRYAGAIALALVGALAAWAPRAGGGAEVQAWVSIVADRDLPLPAARGLQAIEAALATRGASVERATALENASGRVVLVAGLADSGGPAAALLDEMKARVPSEAEALVIRRTERNGRPVIVLCGSDARGLMYAAFDVADRIGWSEAPDDPFSEVRDATERPAVGERALSIYTFQRAYFESRFFDEAYWARYLDMLARNRFNTFVLIFGYENGGYFAPPYPYFFDVEEFPDVRVVDFSKEDQARYLAALRRLIDMTHERGLDFTVGIWDHIYRGGVQGPTDHTKQPTPGLVWGVTAENLVPYSKAAIAKFLREVPQMDAIQFRMHGESGLKRDEMEDFWKSIYRMILDAGRPIRFDARAKEFPDSLIDAAVEMGVNIRICTKYWAEQMGLPFHPTHIPKQNQRDRRHGYADLLRYPRRYKMHWRLWNGGTARILLWGSPDYVRRFAGSTHLYDGDGFEVNEPLATKMLIQQQDTPPFALLKEPYRYYNDEFERYWHFYQTFGRVSYNPATPAEVWEREFARRFGKDAAPYVQRGLHRASWIAPWIMASIFPYHKFPMTRGWVEKQRWDDLPIYARAEGGDTQQFAGFDEEALCVLEGRETAKIRPPDNARWLERTAFEVLAQVNGAERHIGGRRSKEFDSTMTDLRILAHLALYHARRIPAGVSYALWKRSHDLHALDDAIAHERAAIAAWEQVVAAAGDVYADDLMMGVRSAQLCGHWRDELALLREGLAKLEAERRTAQLPLTSDAPAIAHVPVRRLRPGENLVVRATVGGREPVTRVEVCWRVPGGELQRLAMERTRPFLYRGVIPAAALADAVGQVANLPGRVDNPPHCVTYSLEASAGRQRAIWPAGDATSPVVVTVTRDALPPVVVHEKVTSARAGAPLKIAAEVADPAGVKWVRVLYRPVTQFEDYRVLPMRHVEGNRYEAEVPGGEIDPQWDFMYLIEAMDARGNGCIHPNLEEETPYVVVKLER